MLENIEGAIKNRQSKESGNIGYTRQYRKTKQKHNTICVRQTQTTGGKDEPNIFVMRNHN